MKTAVVCRMRDFQPYTKGVRIVRMVVQLEGPVPSSSKDAGSDHERLMHRARFQAN